VRLVASRPVLPRSGSMLAFPGVPPRRFMAAAERRTLPSARLTSLMSARRTSRPGARHAFLTLIAGLSALALPASASAARAKEIKHAKAAGLSYVESQQATDGGFPGDPGNPGFGGEWALTSLAAAHTAPASVKANGSATDARTYYRELIGDTATWPGTSEPLVEDFETAALAAYAAGIDPARVSATQNLFAQILAHYQPSSPGYYGEPELFNATVFGLLALADGRTRTGKQRVPQALLEESVAVVRKNQHSDGGWSYLKAEGSKAALESPAEVELTGAAMAALCGAGVSAHDSSIVAAENYLVAQLKAEPLGSGAFETEFGPNTDSNAWAVEGLDECGISAQGAEFTTTRGKTPLDFLISQQLADGGFGYEAGESSPNFYSSQDALRALAGGGFTAAPPKPPGADRWVYETQFSTSKSVTALLSLIIDRGSGPLEVCAVKISPQAAKTTLADVLQAAEGSAEPAGCVTGFSPASGAGAITSIDGAPVPPDADWKVSIDGGHEKQAKRNTPIEIGDTIYLRLA
jgi:Prenyltransferase and squalene oxidase repeat